MGSKKAVNPSFLDRGNFGKDWAFQNVSHLSRIRENHRGVPHKEFFQAHLGIAEDVGKHVLAPGPKKELMLRGSNTGHVGGGIPSKEVKESRGDPGLS